MAISMEKKLLCIGDSLTEGYGIAAELRWTDLLADELGMEVRNAGVSGDTTAGILARFSSAVSGFQPSHVFIMGGSNDLAFDIPNNIIISNIKTMTRQARHQGIDFIIGIPTPYFMSNANNHDRLFINAQHYSERLSDFQLALKQFALHDETPFVDLSSGMTSDQFMKDGIHMNAKGHLEVMKRVAELLRKLLPDL